MTASITAAAVFGIQYAAAGSTSAPSPTAGSGTEGVDLVRSNRKLKTTTIYSDNDQVAVGPGFQAMHAPITLNCPGSTGTCTFEAEVYGQVNSSTNDNQIAFCTRVDGNYMDEPNCPFIDPIDADGFHTRVSSQSKGGFATGNHSVVTDIFSNGITDGITKITYRVYKP